MTAATSAACAQRAPAGITCDKLRSLIVLIQLSAFMSCP